MPDRAAPGLPTGMGRTWLLLACAAVLPLLLFGGWVGYLSAERMRGEALQAAVARADAAAARLAAGLAAQLDLLRALAASSALDGMDLPAFRVTAERVRAQHGLWHRVAVELPSGAEAMTPLRPPGGTLDRTADTARLRVPVIRDGTVRAVLSVDLLPTGLDALLDAAGAPADWAGLLVDAAGRIVARTGARAEARGDRADAGLQAGSARTPEGVLKGRTPAGMPVATVYHGLAGSDGWVVAYSIPLHLLGAPVRRALVLLMAEGAAGLLLAALLTSLVTRDLSQRRADEAERAARSLRASEEGRAVAVEAAGLGVWRWQAAAGVFDASPRCLALLGTGPHGAGGCGWADAFAAVHARDRPGLDAAIRRSMGAGERLEQEVRVQPAGGAVHWVRVIGRGTPGGLQGVVADISGRKRAEAERLDLLRGMADAQEQERRRIARDLHDQVGQTVAGLSLGLKMLQDRFSAPGSDPVLCDRLAALRGLAGGIGQDIHRAAADLRPAALDDLGLAAALHALARDWSGRHGIATRVQGRDAGRRLPRPVETAVYRVAQEALTNVARHAGATTVSLLLERRGSCLRLIVADDGTGFDPAAAPGDGRPRLGLSGMRERLLLVGGSLELESVAGAGTTLFITAPDLLPCPQAAA